MSEQKSKEYFVSQKSEKLFRMGMNISQEFKDFKYLSFHL